MPGWVTPEPFQVFAIAYGADIIHYDYANIIVNAKFSPLKKIKSFNIAGCWMLVLFEPQDYDGIFIKRGEEMFKS